MPTIKPNKTIEVIDKIFKDPSVVYGLKEFEGIELEKAIYVSEEEKGKYFVKDIKSGKGRLIYDENKGTTKPEEIEIKSFVSSVKAGGQQRQKTRTGVRLTHLPTLLAVKNENERSFEQNKQKAELALLEKLKEHLNLWQTLEKNSPGKINIANKVFSLTKTQK